MAFDSRMDVLHDVYLSGTKMRRHMVNRKDLLRMSLEIRLLQCRVNQSYEFLSRRVSQFDLQLIRRENLSVI